MRYVLCEVINGVITENDTIQPIEYGYDNKVESTSSNPQEEWRWVPVSDPDINHFCLDLNYDANNDKYSLVENKTKYEAALLDQIRFFRNNLLSKTDWIILGDVNVSNITDWQTYRQALRDMPQNINKTATLKLNLDSTISQDDILVSAPSTGSSYNNITIEILDPGASSSLSTSINNQDISITLAHDGTSITSTIQDVIDELNNTGLVNASLESGSVSTNVIDTAFSKTNLSGGEDVYYYTFPTPPSTPKINGVN